MTPRSANPGSRPGRRYAPQRPGELLGLEALEDRRLLAGTPQLLAEINPGAGSQPAEFVAAGGVAYFRADNGSGYGKRFHSVVQQRGEDRRRRGIRRDSVLAAADGRPPKVETTFGGLECQGV